MLQYKIGAIKHPPPSSLSRIPFLPWFLCQQIQANNQVNTPYIKEWIKPFPMILPPLLCMVRRRGNSLTYPLHPTLSLKVHPLRTSISGEALKGPLPGQGNKFIGLRKKWRIENCRTALRNNFAKL